MEYIMVHVNAERKVLTARRMTLIGSATALGMAVLLAGPGAYRHAPNLTALSSSAQAAEAVQSGGFADLVAKVKPAVISVRVTMNSAARTASSDNERNGDAFPFRRGSP